MAVWFLVPIHGWNLCPLQWKHIVLTTGPQGVCLKGYFCLKDIFTSCHAYCHMSHLHYILYVVILHYVPKRIVSDVMPKSWNLPTTTQEPIPDAKTREFLLPSSSWGSHHYRRSGYREEPRVVDYIASIGSIHRKKGFLGRGTSDWSLSFEGLCVGCWLAPIV